MKFKENAGANDSKNYLRLKDKESAKGVFVGDPYEFRKHWVGNKTELCSEDSLCPHCAAGLKSAFRFRINFIINEGGVYTAKVFEQGWNTYLALKSLHEGDYDLEKHVMRVSREGAGKNDTTYSILPVPKGEITAAQAKEIAKVALADLRHKEEAPRVNNVKEEEFTPTPAFNSDEEIPF